MSRFSTCAATTTSYEFERRPGGDDLPADRDFRGYSFLGLEGSINYNRAASYTDTEMFVKVLRLLPRLLVLRSVRGYSVDVVVAHSRRKEFTTSRTIARTVASERSGC